MISIYILLLTIVLCGLSFNKGGFYNDYIDIKQTNAIKGIFIILVFVRHVLQYVYDSGYSFSNYGDHYVEMLDGMLKQLLVAYFLFCSGYGVMESIKKKGENYIGSIPRKRIAVTLVNFDIAVLIFFAADLLIGSPVSVTQFLQSLISWESIGNSNWYIFAILYCYAASYISFSAFNNSKNGTGKSVCLLFALCIIYLVAMQYFKPSHWYNTIFCYPAGLLFSNYRHHIKTNPISRYLFALTLLIVFFIITYMYDDSFGIAHNICSIVFCLIIVFCNMKIKVENIVLSWMGSNLFPLYIYQRLPMMLIYYFAGARFVSQYPNLYIYASLLLTIAIAYMYKFIRIKRV